MGLFRVDLDVADVRRAARAARVTGVLVDTGSELTWLPAEKLTKAGVRVAKKDVLFVLANGAEVKRATGYAIIRAEGFETVDEIVFAQDGDLSLLGARTLEGFGAVVDPRRKRIAAAGPHVAARVR